MTASDDKVELQEVEMTANKRTLSLAIPKWMQLAGLQRFPVPAPFDVRAQLLASV